MAERALLLVANIAYLLQQVTERVAGTQWGRAPIGRQEAQEARSFALQPAVQRTQSEINTHARAQQWRPHVRGQCATGRYNLLGHAPFLFIHWGNAVAKRKKVTQKARSNRKGQVGRRCGAAMASG